MGAQVQALTDVRFGVFWNLGRQVKCLGRGHGALPGGDILSAMRISYCLSFKRPHFVAASCCIHGPTPQATKHVLLEAGLWSLNPSISRLCLLTLTCSMVYLPYIQQGAKPC